MSLEEANEAYTELVAAAEEITESLKQYKENVTETLCLLPDAVLPCDTEEATKKAAWALYWNCPKIPVRAIAEALGLKGHISAYVGPAILNVPCSKCGGSASIEVKTRTESEYSWMRKRAVCESCRLEQEQNEREAERRAERQKKEATARYKTESDFMTLEEARAMPYAEYLKTQHWQDIRKRALRRAKYKCQLCNRDGTLHTHHKTYENLGCEQNGDVIVLCGECHARHHDKETM